MSHSSFDELVQLVDYHLNSEPLWEHASKKPSPWHLKRQIFPNRWIVAMVIKYLLSCAEIKDLHVHFGATCTSFWRCVNFGLKVLVKVLIEHPKARVFWDRSHEALEAEAKRTQQFLDIPNVVGFIDSDKLPTLQPSDLDLQNCNYNGWTKECLQNIVLIWNTHGQIVDCAVNLPGNFHDSRSTKWGGLYDHIGKLPDPYKVCCDDSFYTGGFLQGKLVKTKEQF